MISFVSKVCFKRANSTSHLFPPGNCNLHRIIKRRFSRTTDTQCSYPVGPSLAQPLTPKDPGYSQFLKNVEFYRENQRHTYLSLEAFQAMKASPN